MSQIRNVELDLIRADPAAQPRVAMMTDEVAHYVERMAEGDEFPPLVVFFDGKVYWLGDGFHRYHAAMGCGLAEFVCDVREGGLRDAILHSVGANAGHGIRRTNEDKNRAVLTLLRDPEWGRKPEREMARVCRVSHTFVQNVRSRYLATLPDKPAVREVARGGTTYDQNTANIGSREPAWFPRNVASTFSVAPRQIDLEEAIASAPARPEPYNRGETRLYHDLTEMLRRMEGHPDPEAAVRAFSPQLRHALNADQLRAFAKWAGSIADAWERTQGAFHVAAE